MEEQWRFGKERVLGWRGGETTGWRKRNEAKLIFGERLYVMGQVIRVGLIICLILQKCHWNSILKNWKHQKFVFSFHNSNSFFWVLSFGNWVKKLIQTNKVGVGLTKFGKGVMNTENWMMETHKPNGL